MADDSMSLLETPRKVSADGDVASDVFIGADLGTSGVRALATDGLGRRLGMTHRSVPVLAPSRDTGLAGVREDPVPA